MRRLLVASIFSGGERDPSWLMLQQENLSRTVGNIYDHAVYLSHGADHSLFSDKIIIGVEELDKSQILQQILTFFRANPYDFYLILDHDAFPFREGWLEILSHQIRRANVSMAAAVFTENWGTFPSPSVFFLRGGAVFDDRIDFHFRVGKNLTGSPIRDIGVGMTGLPMYPLLRSNARNFHPVMGGLYGHLFYRHGEGSAASSRSLEAGTSDHYLRSQDHAAIDRGLFQELIENPQAYLQRLASHAECG